MKVETIQTKAIRQGTGVVNPVLKQFTEKDDAVKRLNLILMGHSAFQLLNAGCELGLFEELYRSPGLAKEELGQVLQLEERPLNCLLLGLTALELIEKKGDSYFNCVVIGEFIKNKFWKTFHDVVVFESKIVYLGQYDFVESLRKNKNSGLNKVNGQGEDLYHRLNETPELQCAFYNYMSSWSQMAIPLLLNTGIFDGSIRILDLGGGDGTNAIEIARNNPNARITLFELKENSFLPRRKIVESSLEQQVEVVEGNIFVDEFGEGYDYVVFIHLLVIWSKKEIDFLLRRAHGALKAGGKVVIFNSITRDQEDGPLFGALDSVYFLATPVENGGMIYPWKFYESCLKESGFSSIERIDFNAWSPHGAVVAYK
jgi:SAM-dependent methyltransferase